jgi:hypothetical protein
MMMNYAQTCMYIVIDYMAVYAGAREGSTGKPESWTVSLVFSFYFVSTKDPKIRLDNRRGPAIGARGRRQSG